MKDLAWAWIKSKNKPCWPRISFMLKPNFSPFIFGLLTQIFYSANLELTHENWAHKCPYSTQWARVGNTPRLRSLFAGTDPGLGPGPMAQFFFYSYYVYHFCSWPLPKPFFFREFQPITSTSDDQNKTPISFWCRRRLNSKSFIQQS